MYTSGHDDPSLVVMATCMAKFLINRALLQCKQGLKRIQEVCVIGIIFMSDF